MSIIHQFSTVPKTHKRKNIIVLSLRCFSPPHHAACEPNQGAETGTSQQEGMQSHLQSKGVR
jgi:hypothetical protein